MHHNNSKKQELIRLTIVYSFMVMAVIVIVAFISLFMLGYRFDKNGDIEQYGLLQFSSTPSGASVSVDDQVVGASTPTKKTVSAGTHKVVMWRDGYESWSKTMDVKSGTIVWLNYALLVPSKLTVSPVSNFESIIASLASPNGNYMLIQSKVDSPIFDLVDISSDQIKTTKIEIPSQIISEVTTSGISHSFQIMKWDDGERYVLVKHTYGDKVDWLLLDTQDINSSKNITGQIGIDISAIDFFGTNGRTFYVLSGNELKKINLSNNSVSKAIVSNVSSFKLYDKSNVITFVATDPTDGTKTFAGIYRDGDSRFYNLRTTTDPSIAVAAAHYFNVDYVAIAEGSKLDILSGNFPSVDRDSSTSLKILKSFTLNQNIGNLSFSPTGQYVFMQNKSNFTSYNLEYEKLMSSSISSSPVDVHIGWIDDNYIWSDAGGKLTIREFDGQNIHVINDVQMGQNATLTHNGRFLYSIGKAATGYQLQRVRMILP